VQRLGQTSPQHSLFKRVRAAEEAVQAAAAAFA